MTLLQVIRYIRELDGRMRKKFGAKMSKKLPKISKKLLKNESNRKQKLVESVAKIRHFEGYIVLIIQDVR